jgi:FkbM family methyltransferase
MPGSRKWIGALLLGTPRPIRSLRNLPIIGKFIHSLSHLILPGDERVWACVEAGPAKGLWLELNPRTGQSYLRGETEVAIQRVLEERLKPGMVFYDLGANIGLFSMLGARLVGPTGKVFSFEPDPETAARLRRNIARNGSKRAVVIQSGVWSTTGKLVFVGADASSPDHGVGKFVKEQVGENGSLLDCIALDDFIQNAPAPDAIKCDVEGAEVEVFRGAKRILKSHRPWIICELHSESNQHELCRFLGSFGYRFSSIDANHLLAEPNRDS